MKRETKRSVLLSLHESRRQIEERQLNPDVDYASFSTARLMGLIPEDLAEEIEVLTPEVEKAVTHLLNGGRVNEKVEEVMSKQEELLERKAEYLRKQDVVGPAMESWAEKEAQQKGLLGFGQKLARSAFEAAGRGVLERDWTGRVLGWAYSQPEPSIGKAYQAEIADLRSKGPWPWPREQDVELPPRSRKPRRRA
jgi:hypothetical protein